jgi:DNA-binding NarL/FixJ family response regulator
MSYRILIADAHPLMRMGLRALLSTNPAYQVVFEATDGRDAVAQTVQLQPDLAMLDLNLPGLTGVDSAIQIRRRNPRQKILALGEADSELHASEAMRAGCTGCVQKDCGPDEMLLAVKTVLTGNRYLGQSLAAILLDEMLQPSSARQSRPWDRLSSRERSIFKLIAEGGTNRSAAAYLSLSSKTVEKHRASLMRKLNVASAVELTLLAVELGVVTRPPVAGRPALVPAVDVQ